MAVLYDGGILINYFMECMVAQTQKQKHYEFNIIF